MNKQSIATIEVQELKQLLDADPNLCLIDVREVYEWQTGHIEGASLIPKEELTTRIESKISDRDHPIYLHCKGGVRSLYAAQCLMDMGFKNVYSVNGGILEWEGQGYPVVR
jgi:rhodanese-related sulfurtransferase